MSTTSSRFPRFLTFPPGELEAKLREIDTSGNTSPLSGTYQGTNTVSTVSMVSTVSRLGRSKLTKSHTCSVLFPDRIAGRCRYTRGGPGLHTFQFEHGGQGTGFTTHSLPPHYWLDLLPDNGIATIEAKARELAEQAYLKAALREQSTYFARASEGMGRRKNPALYRMTTKRAKQIGGNYALCFRTDTGDGLIPIAPSHPHLNKVNAAWLEAWREKGDRRVVVGCCNRLDRCWQLPYFNPLYAEFDPRPQAQDKASAEACPPKTWMIVVPAASATVPTPIPTATTMTTVVSPAIPIAGDDWEYLPDPDDDGADSNDDEDEDDGDHDENIGDFDENKEEAHP